MSASLESVRESRLRLRAWYTRMEPVTLALNRVYAMAWIVPVAVFCLGLGSSKAANPLAPIVSAVVFAAVCVAVVLFFVQRRRAVAVAMTALGARLGGRSCADRSLPVIEWLLEHWVEPVDGDLQVGGGAFNRQWSAMGSAHLNVLVFVRRRDPG